MISFSHNKKQAKKNQAKKNKQNSKYTTTYTPHDISDSTKYINVLPPLTIFDSPEKQSRRPLSPLKAFSSDRGEDNHLNHSEGLDPSSSSTRGSKIVIHYDSDDCEINESCFSSAKNSELTGCSQDNSPKSGRGSSALESSPIMKNSSPSPQRSTSASLVYHHDDHDQELLPTNTSPQSNLKQAKLTALKEWRRAVNTSSEGDSQMSNVNDENTPPPPRSLTTNKRQPLAVRSRRNANDNSGAPVANKPQPRCIGNGVTSQRTIPSSDALQASRRSNASSNSSPVRSWLDFYADSTPSSASLAAGAASPKTRKSIDKKNSLPTPRIARESLNSMPSSARTSDISSTPASFLSSSLLSHNSQRFLDHNSDTSTPINGQNRFTGLQYVT